MHLAFCQYYNMTTGSTLYTSLSVYQLPRILTALLTLSDKLCLSHGMCHYQVMMTLHFLNYVVNDSESIQK